MAKKKAPWPIGLKIKEIRWMTPEELGAMAWDQEGVVIVLEDGGLIFPSSDPEGNSAGVLMSLHKGSQIDLLYPPDPRDWGRTPDS